MKHKKTAGEKCFYCTFRGTALEASIMNCGLQNVPNFSIAKILILNLDGNKTLFLGKGTQINSQKKAHFEMWFMQY